jgi:hypothetical protein
VSPIVSRATISLASISSLQTIWLLSLYNWGDMFIFDLPGLRNLSTLSDLPGKSTRNITTSDLSIKSTNVTLINITTEMMSSMMFVDNPGPVDFTLRAHTVTDLAVNATNINLSHLPDKPGLNVTNTLGVLGCQTYMAKYLVYVGSFLFYSTTTSSALWTIPASGNFQNFNNPKIITIRFVPSYLLGSSTSAIIDGGFYVTECLILGSISLALKDRAMTSISGSVLITDNYALTNISFPDLTSVGSSMKVASCSSVTSISMPNLKSVGGDLIITNNSDLSFVTGFTNLQTIAGKFHLEGNISM